MLLQSEMAKSIAANVKPPDLCQIESEIAQLRQTECLSTEQETEIIKMELDVLKGYCDKLSNIQEENDQLKRECESLKQKLFNQEENLRSSKGNLSKIIISRFCNIYIHTIQSR